MAEPTDARAAEPLSAPSYDGARVSAGVVSTGCTRAEHFAVEHEIDAGRCLLTVVRSEPDRCRRAPAVVTVHVPWVAPAECAGLPTQFTNPVLAPPRTLPPMRPDGERSP